MLTDAPVPGILAAEAQVCARKFRIVLPLFMRRGAFFRGGQAVVAVCSRKRLSGNTVCRRVLDDMCRKTVCTSRVDVAYIEIARNSAFRIPAVMVLPAYCYRRNMSANQPQAWRMACLQGVQS